MKHSLRSFCRLAAYAMTVWAPFGLSANSTQSLEIEGFEGWVKGKLQNLALSEDGLIQMGPALESLAKVGEPVVWDAALDGRGNLVMGTGNAGKVVRLDTRKGEVETLFEPAESLTRAVAIGPEGHIYAATSPEGAVYRIDDAGQVSLFFDPGEKYVWDLHFDADGHLYVATGEDAVIYKLAPGFKLSDEPVKVFEAPQTHVHDLALEADGDLLAGTGPDGYLYRIDGEGNAFPLFDTGIEEIREIIPGPRGRITFLTFGEDRGNGDNAIPGSLLGRITPEGFAEAFFGQRGLELYSLVPSKANHWLLGTGRDGQVWRVDEDGNFSVLQRAEDGGEVSVMIEDPQKDALYVITSNPGRVYQLQKTPAARAAFASPPLDAEQIAAWGAAEVFGRGGPIQEGYKLETRTGNTSTPDDQWSKWSTPQPSGNIASPTARFIQFRLALERPGLDIRKVRLFYRHANRQPIVQAVTVVPYELEVYEQRQGPEKVDVQKLFDEDEADEAIQEPPQRKQVFVGNATNAYSAAWRAGDPNGDELRYSVHLRHVEDAQWTALARGLIDPIHAFTVEGLADGYYELKVEADDAIANLPGEGRTASRRSRPFLLDSHEPRITFEGLSHAQGTAELTFSVRDAFSRIAEAQYILDGEPARLALPKDHLFDQNAERFVLRFGDLDQGDYSILFEAADEAGNRATRRVHFSLRD